MRFSIPLVLVCASTLLLACDDDDDDDDGITNPATVSSVVITPGDAATLDVGATLDLAAVAMDNLGETITGRTIAWSTSDAAVAQISAATGDEITVTGVADGTTRIIASSEGVADTVNVTVSSSAVGNSASVNMQNNSFVPPTVTVAATGTVTWTNLDGRDHNVTFADPAAVTGGNVPSFSTGSNARTFPTAGTFRYECTIHNGMTGTVTVE